LTDVSLVLELAAANALQLKNILPFSPLACKQALVATATATAGGSLSLP